jgi:hypothetical protein
MYRIPSAMCTRVREAAAAERDAGNGARGVEPPQVTVSR